MGRRSGLSIVALAALALGRVDASALSDKIYTQLTPTGVSKLLNINGWIGASSLERGSIGYLYRIDHPSQIAGFQQSNGPFYNGEGYIVLLAQSVVANKTAMGELLFQQQLRGVLIYDDGDRSAYSCGNIRPGFGLGTADASSPQWNQVGGGYGQDDQYGLHWTGLIQGPVFLLSDADAALVNARYDASRNLNSPGKVQPNMLGARLEFFMWAAGNAKMCLRRIAGGDVGSPFCLPLGGWSAVGSLDPAGHSKEAIVVAAPMDAVSLFHEESWGANAGAAALAALVATARMVTYGLTDSDRAGSLKQIYFAAFEGESFDNIGSTAFYSQLLGGRFPTGSSSASPANVKKWLEFGQLGTGAAINVYNVNPAEATFSASVFGNASSTATTAPGQTAASSVANSAPSSIRKLASLPDRFSVTNPFSSVEATLITDVTASSFTNQFFQSRLDNATNLGLTNASTASDANIVALCDVLRGVALTLTLEAGVSAPATRDANLATTCQQIVLNVLQGLLLNSSQPVQVSNASGIEYQAGIAGDGRPLTRYVSVYNGKVQSAAEAFMYFQLGGALQLPNAPSTDGCSNSESASSYHTLLTNIVGNDQYCFNTTVFWIEALSPAFSEDGITYSITDDSGVYSTWTESTWDEGNLEIFLMQDAQEAHALVGGGAVYAVVITLFVYFFNKKIAISPDLQAPGQLTPNI